jgi:hypothetical protein
VQNSHKFHAAKQKITLDWKRSLAARKEPLLTVSLIFIVCILSFGRFNTNILISDDWSYFVARYVFGELQPIILTDRRPLVLVVYYALASIFGLQFKYYYFFNFLVLFFSAFMMYVIVKRISPRQGWLAGCVALAYLIYPVDYTRTWLIMMYIRFWWLVSLGVIWLYLEYAATGKRWVYALGMLGTAIPLGAYEGQFGILLLASALIAFISNHLPAIRRWTLLAGTVGIALAFLLWRTYLQARLFQINDAYLGSLQFTPAVLLERLLYGLYIFSVGWVRPILAQLHLTGFNLLPWLLSYVAIGCAIFFCISSKESPQDRLEIKPKRVPLKPLLTLFLMGCAFWVAGYFPIIILYRPALAPISSRVNTFAVPGAALMLVSAVLLIATLITNSPRLQKTIATIAILPFIFAGIFVQFHVDQENQIKWDTQKRIWNGVFATIPNIQDGKSIVMIIPGYRHLRPFELFPFLSAWEIEAETQILYNKPGLGGLYYYGDIQPAGLHFTKNGFRPIPTDKIVPYKKLIFVYYDPQSDSVTLVEDLQDTILLPFQVNNYYPRENIIPAEASTAEFRWLVK